MQSQVGTKTFIKESLNTEGVYTPRPEPQKWCIPGGTVTVLLEALHVGAQASFQKLGVAGMSELEIALH